MSRLICFQRQFQKYQIYKLPEAIVKTKRADTQWVMIGQICAGDRAGKLFGELSKTMLDTLKFFHANAECERVFTQTRKAKKETHGKMKVSRLNRILQHKMLLAATGRNCLNFEPCAELLKACKSATYRKNHGLDSDSDRASDNDSDSASE